MHLYHQNLITCRINHWVKIYKFIFLDIFFITTHYFDMSKRYSGKSFKDSSIKKKPKLSFKEKRKLKKEKQKMHNKQPI